MDYTDDLRIGPDIVKGVVESYRRLRNTLRYLLGNLDGFDESERVAPAAMPELERWVLHRLAELEETRRRAFAEYEYHRFYGPLHAFCASDLSAFYFDVRKDSLYCDALGSARRRAARSVLHILFDTLTAWLAPVLAFTAEEAWLARHPDTPDSVHLRAMPEIPPSWRADALAEKWRRLRAIRRAVTGALEVARRERRIGSSLQARPRVWLAGSDAACVEGTDLAALAIASDLEVAFGAAPEDAFRLEDAPGVGVIVEPAPGEKCAGAGASSPKSRGANCAGAARTRRGHSRASSIRTRVIGGRRLHRPGGEDAHARRAAAAGQRVGRYRFLQPRPRAQPWGGLRHDVGHCAVGVDRVFAERRLHPRRVDGARA